MDCYAPLSWNIDFKALNAMAAVCLMKCRSFLLSKESRLQLTRTRERTILWSSLEPTVAWSGRKAASAAASTDSALMPAPLAATMISLQRS
jgi:hypothetical protein